MLRNLTLFGLLVTLACLSACNPKPEEVTVSGKGGNAALQVHPFRGSDTLDSCKVYIKYNVLIAPTEGPFDDSMACNVVDEKMLAVFTTLHRGNYYLVGKGYTNHQVFLKGGIGIHVDDENGIYKVQLPMLP